MGKYIWSVYLSITFVFWLYLGFATGTTRLDSPVYGLLGGLIIWGVLHLSSYLIWMRVRARYAYNEEARNILKAEAVRDFWDYDIGHLAKSLREQKLIDKDMEALLHKALRDSTDEHLKYLANGAVNRKAW